jgi:hypothetical protein
MKRFYRNRMNYIKGDEQVTTVILEELAQDIYRKANGREMPPNAMKPLWLEQAKRQLKFGSAA